MEATIDFSIREIEKPLRQTQTAYADYIEHQLLPMAARYITSQSAKEYKHIERIQIIDSLRYIQLGHLNSIGLGATTKSISKRVKTSIRPKVLAVWQKSLILLEDELLKDDLKAYSAEIQTRCKSYDIPFESLDQYWKEVVSVVNKKSTNSNAKSDWKDLTLPDITTNPNAPAQTSEVINPPVQVEGEGDLVSSH